MKRIAAFVVLAVLSLAVGTACKDDDEPDARVPITPQFDAPTTSTPDAATTTPDAPASTTDARAQDAAGSDA